MNEGKPPSKTQSQRLRAVLFRQWEQWGSVGEFDTFYRNEMKRIIDQEKDKLEPQNEKEID